MKWYFKALYHYFDFTGRARRKEFWVFTLFNLSLIWLLYFLNGFFDHEYFLYAVYIYAALIIIPNIAVFLRRMHDIGKTGWNILWIIIPFIGWLWLLILLWFVGEPKHNKWGAYPKGVEGEY